MQRQSIIVLINGEQVEAWGSLKEACIEHRWITNPDDKEYYKIARHVREKPLIEWKGWLIHRCPFRALYTQEGGEKKLEDKDKIMSKEHKPKDKRQRTKATNLR